MGCQMAGVHVAAFIGAGIYEVILALSDIDAAVEAIDAEFDGVGVPRGRITRTAKIKEDIKAIRRNSLPADFSKIAYMIAYVYAKKHGMLTAKYGIVAVLVDNNYVDQMHIVDCNNEMEYTAFIESMRKTVEALWGRSVTWHIDLEQMAS